MARILRDTRSGPWRARPVAAGLALAAVLAGGAWWAAPRAGAPVKDVAAGPVAPDSPGDPPRAGPAADPRQAESTTRAPMAIALERIELAPSGRIAAVLRVNGGPAGRHLQGDSLGVGVRVARIGVDRIQVESNGTLETYGLPPGAPALPVNVRHAQGRPASLTWPMPPTPAVAQILQEPSQTGVVTASPDRANPARSGIDRLVVGEAMRLSTP